MTTRSFLIVLCLLPASVVAVTAQLKHLGDHRGVVDAGGSFARSGPSEAYEAGFQYTNDGNIGIGISYLNLQSYPRMNGFGVGVEKALLRPTDRAGLGMSLFGSISTAWGSTVIYTPISSWMGQVNYTGNTISVRQTVFGGGAEIYLHMPRWRVNLEPFLRAGYSSVRSTAGYSSQTMNVFSAALGADLLVSLFSSDRIIITPAVHVAEHSLPTVIGQIMYSHAYH